MTASSGFNQDFLDLLSTFVEARVDFVVVGAHALAVHGIPRATGDLDVFVSPAEGNARRVMAALRQFGAPVDAHGLTLEDLERPGTVYQIGQPPRRVDIMTSISGVSFDEAFESRTEVEVAGRMIAFLGRQTLLRNKLAAGRAKDLLDVKLLNREKRR